MPATWADKQPPPSTPKTRLRLSKRLRAAPATGLRPASQGDPRARVAENQDAASGDQNLTSGGRRAGPHGCASLYSLAVPAFSFVPPKTREFSTGHRIRNGRNPEFAFFFHQKEHVMSAQVDKFCDSLHTRLDAAESRLESLKTNVQSLRKQGEQALRDGLEQARREAESRKQQFTKAQSNLKARAEQKVRTPKKRSRNGRQSGTSKNSMPELIAPRRMPTMRSISP